MPFNKIVLAIALVLGSNSLAAAQGFDPNLGNRIPQLNDPGVYGYQYGRNVPGLLPPAIAHPGMESAPVGLHTGRYAPRHRGYAGPLRSAPVGLYQGYGGLQTAPVAMEMPGISVVGPDNYRYWHQACCF
jgi:hypothetical protein